MHSLIDTIIRWSGRWRMGSQHTMTAPGPSRRELAPGEKWGQYQILAKLGEGAFGQVYRARDPLDRLIALKLLHGADAIREGKALSRLQHPNIVQVHSYVEHNEEPALAMEYVAGRNLEQYVRDKGRLDARHASLIGSDLCRGLALVHGKRLLHRDIKASNVVRRNDGRVVLVDFGLGGRADTKDAELVGTLPYMAPELFEGRTASVRSDLYAVGVLLHFLVSLEHPVVADSPDSFREAHRAGNRVHLEDIRPDLPGRFLDVVRKAIHPVPECRFRSAGALAGALDEVLRERPKRAVWPVWVATAGVLLVAAGAVWLATRNEADVPSPMLFTRLTSEDALSREPTLSADGTLLAYSSDQAEEGNLDIWVRQVPNGGSLRLTQMPTDESVPALSPDGHWVAFRAERDGGGVYVMSALGGEQRLVARGAFAPRFSPDGRHLAYWVGESGHPRWPSGKLYVVPASGGSPRQLAPEMADARNPVWAPDSQHVLFQGSRDPEVPPDNGAEWWVAALDGSSLRNTGALAQLRDEGLEAHTDAAYWDNDNLLFSAARGENVNLWRVRLARGWFDRSIRPARAQRVTNGAAFETSPWTGTKGQLVYSHQKGSLRIWSFPLRSGTADAMQRITNTSDLDSFPSATRDRAWLAFTRTQSETGLRQIWLRHLPSGQETQLTNTRQYKSNPVISPDGVNIAYNVRDETGHSILLMDRGTRQARRLCGDCGVVADWSPQGDALLSFQRDTINRLDIASGRLTVVVTKPGLRLEDPAWSPDGRWIALSAHRPGEERRVFVISPDGVGQWTPWTDGKGWADKPRWASDGAELLFYSNQDGYPCLWSRLVEGASGWAFGPARPVRHFHNTRRSPLHVSQPVRCFAVVAGQAFVNLAENSASVWMGVPTAN